MNPVDRSLLIWFRTRGHTPGRERAVNAYSRLGEHSLGWLALGAAGARWDPSAARRGQWRHGVGCVIGAYGVNQVLKRVIRRPRPQLASLPPLTHTMSQLSFPSAHSTTSFAAARAYRGLLPAPVLYGFAGTLALSRLYLGVHYPSDVTAGALLGHGLAEVMSL